MSLPKHYVSGLSQKDKKKQIRSLKKSRKNYKKKTKSKKQKYYTRPRLKSFKNKPSRWRVSFQKKYPQAKTMKEIAKVSGIPYKALQEVKKKGMGAYYSSGSRPNQTAESWGIARMYAYIMGSPTRKVDYHITEKYKITFKVKPNYYSYT
jgi:hypothetical protein